MMVTAAAFNEVFDEVVAGPLVAVGAWQQGRRVFYADGSLMVALLRVEHRWIPPAELQLAVRHRLLRTMDDEEPTKPPTNPSEYPIRLRPSEADSLLSPRWRYSPVVGHGTPTDSIGYPEMTADQCRVVLKPIGTKLAEVVPQLSGRLSVERVFRSMQRFSSDTWIEQRWIEDLKAAPHRSPRPTTRGLP